MTPLLAEAEQFTKPGTANVGPGDLRKLAPLMRHYAANPHPFSACKRDQLKHGLSEDHANRRCAVLKDLIKGTTKWRGKEEEDAALEAVEEAEDRLVAIAEVVGESTVAILVESGQVPEGDSTLAQLAAEIADCSTILEYVAPTLSEAYDPPSWATPSGSKGVTAKGTRIGGRDDPEFEKKHPRAQRGSPTGGKFVRKGSSGEVVSSIQSRLGVSTTGTFDEATRRAVMRYQRNHGLTVDGIIGRQTATSLAGGGKVATGELTGRLRRRLSKFGGKSKEEFIPGLLTEEVVDVETRTRDDGTKTATYDRIRSALYDLSSRTSKTREVRLPNGVTVTARELPPDRYGIRKTEYTVKRGDGRRQKCDSAVEAADLAKDWDAAAGVVL